MSPFQPSITSQAPFSPIRQQSDLPRPVSAMNQSAGLPRFGNTARVALMEMGRPTRLVNTTFSWLGKSRTREMLVEDLLGFGLLRTGMDLMRGYFYGNAGAGTGDPAQKFNLPMARERSLREVGSIFTDNMSSGIAAAILARLWLDRGGKAYSRQFTSFPTLELFRDVLSQAPGGSEDDFLRELARRITEKNPNKTAAVESLLLPQAFTQQGATELAASIARTLGQETLDVSLSSSGRQASFQLPELLSDARLLLGEMQSKAIEPQVTKALQEGLSAGAAPGLWQEQAAKLVDRTLKAKRAQMACLGVGIGLTMAVPYAIRWLTKKVDKIDYYPGLIGLQTTGSHALAVNSSSMQSGTPFKSSVPAFASNIGRADSPFGLGIQTRHGAFNAFAQARLQNGAGAVNSPSVSTPPVFGNPADHRSGLVSKLAHAFPYLTDSVKQGNFWPIAGTLLPLPFAAGLFDTVSRTFNNPFKKGFLTKLRNMYDFGKGFPFTTQQQMASMFAVLIMSRLSSARNGDEFRERLVDSCGGWMLWILGTPLIKRAIAGYLDKRHSTELLKQTGNKLMLKSRAEIEHLITDPTVLRKTLKSSIWLQAGSFLTTLILMGIIEPYLAIRWTKRNHSKMAES